MIVWN